MDIPAQTGLTMAEREDVLEAFTRHLFFEDYPGTNSSAQEAARWPVGVLGSWKTMESITPSVIATAIYLLLVLRIVPDFISSQKRTFTLKFPMAIYNIVQIVYSYWLVHQVFCRWDNVTYFISAITDPANHQISPEFERVFSTIAWYYLICKYIEFLDTIFFVLRGKQNQVSFLHVYHHTNMAISTWIYVRYVRPSHLMPIVVANSGVHCVMYLYYLLAAMGPAVRPYLWWKRYITRIQLIQFAFVIMYMVAVVYYRCPVQKFYFFYTIVNTSSFIVLFSNFYTKTYKKPTSKMNGVANGHVNKLNGHSNGHANGIVELNGKKDIKAE